MKFRSHVERTVRDDTGIHAAVVGPEWRSLPPVLHQAAISAGCEVDKSRFKAEGVERKAGEGAQGQHDERSVIRQGIEALLKRDEDEDFTHDGAPLVDSINKATGMTHSKSLVNEVWKGMQDEAAKADAERADALAQAEQERADALAANAEQAAEQAALAQQSADEAAADAADQPAAVTKNTAKKAAAKKVAAK